MIPTRLQNLLRTLDNFVDERKEHHPEKNVGNHLRQCAQLALSAGWDYDICMAAMLHDIGKNTTDKEQLLNHAFRGANMIALDVSEYTHWLVLNHMRMYDYTKMRPEKRKALEANKWFGALTLLHQLDKQGREPNFEPFSWDVLFEKISKLDTRTNIVIMLIGIQASGKSSYSRKLVELNTNTKGFKGIKSRYFRTNRDDIRSLFAVGPEEWRYQEKAIVKVQQDQIRMALARNQIPIIDNCHNTVKRRAEMLNWLRNEFPYIDIKAQVVYAPITECLERNRKEHGNPLRHKILIPDDVIKQFHSDLVSGFGVKSIEGNQDKIMKKLFEEGFNDVGFTDTTTRETAKLPE